MTTRQSLVECIKNYKTSFIAEASFGDKFIDLLQHPHAFSRNHLPGHITGSTWIIDETKQFALLTHHAKLNKWLQPGGHADGEENIIEVCMKEAFEETGLKNLKLLNPDIFDLDIHIIPARKDFPQHLHFDVRLLFQTSKQESLTVTEESHDLSWIAAAELPELTGHNASIIRMSEKIKHYFEPISSKPNAMTTSQNL